MLDVLGSLFYVTRVYTGICLFLYNDGLKRLIKGTLCPVYVETEDLSFSKRGKEISVAFSSSP